MATLRQVCRLKGHEDRVWSVAWRPLADPPQLASCGTDRIIRLWAQRASAPADADDGWVLRTEIDTTACHTRTLRSLSWSPSGDLLVAASFDASTSLWQEAESSEGGCTFEQVTSVTGHESEVKAAAFSPSGDFLATCSRDKSVWIYETHESFEYECLAVLQSHAQDVKMVAWHPGQDVLFSCSYDDTIKVWGPDGDDWACKQTLSGHESTVWSLSFDAQGSRFVTCSDDRTLRIWAPEGEAAEPAPEPVPANRAAAGPVPASRGPSIAAAAYLTPLFRRPTVEAAALQAAEVPAPDSCPGPPPRRAPANAACDWRTTAVIDDQHPRPIYSVSWLPFGTAGSSTSIASACGDNHIRVFQPRNEAALEGWSCVADVEAHFGDANCVAWCPKALPGEAALLASAGDDGEVVLWRFGG